MNKVLVFLTTLLLASCGDDFTERNAPKGGGSGPILGSNNTQFLTSPELVNSGEFTLTKMIANVGSLVTAPLVEEFTDSIKELTESIGEHCQTIQNQSTFSKEEWENSRLVLREKWHKSMDLYHQWEMMNYGPSNPEDSPIGGLVYSYDQEVKCSLDRELVKISRSGRLPNFAGTVENKNIRGLDSLGPLFFSDPDKSRCARPRGAIQAWFSSPLIEREKGTCLYMNHVMEDVMKQTGELKKFWDKDQNYYPLKMVSGVLGSEIQVINKVSQALFYLDTEHKDRRLAWPLGIEVMVGGKKDSCKKNCGQKTQHLYSDSALRSLKNSLLGFKHLFMGITHKEKTDGFGIDDLLRQRGHESVAQSMQVQIEDILSYIESLKQKKSSFRVLVESTSQGTCENSNANDTNNPGCALYWKVKGLNDSLKGEYLLALNDLNAPRSAQGDGD